MHENVWGSACCTGPAEPLACKGGMRGLSTGSAAADASWWAQPAISDPRTHGTPHREPLPLPRPACPAPHTHPRQVVSKHLLRQVAIGAGGEEEVGHLREG